MFDALGTTVMLIPVVHKTLLVLFELYDPKRSSKRARRHRRVDIDKLTASAEPVDRLVGEILREIQTREKKPLGALKPAEIERYTVELAKIAQKKALSEHPPRREVAEKILRSLRKEYASV